MGTVMGQAQTTSRLEQYMRVCLWECCSTLIQYVELIAKKKKNWFKDIGDDHNLGDLYDIMFVFNEILMR